MSLGDRKSCVTQTRRRANTHLGITMPGQGEALVCVTSTVTLVVGYIQILGIHKGEPEFPNLLHKVRLQNPYLGF